MSALVNPKHERYAFERALLVPRLQAARAAGYENMTAGNAAKLDRKPKIAARIAELRGDDVEMLRAKRAKIEERLSKSAYGDILDLAKIDPETKKPVIDWQAVKESDLSVTISEFVFDKETGEMVRFKRDDANAAIAQLRDLHGFSAPKKIAPTNPAGDGPAEMKVMAEHTAVERAQAINALIAKVGAATP